MAEGRQRADWDRTAAVLSMLYNINRDPKKGRALSPEDFNPYAPKREEARQTINRKEAMELFQAIAKGR